MLLAALQLANKLATNPVGQWVAQHADADGACFKSMYVVRQSAHQLTHRSSKPRTQPTQPAGAPLNNNENDDGGRSQSR